MKRTLTLIAIAVLGCTAAPAGGPPTPQAPSFEAAVIPMPVSLELDPARRFIPDTVTTIQIIEGADQATQDVAAFLRSMLAPPLRADVLSVPAATGFTGKSIGLRIDSTAANGALEGYELAITESSIIISARNPAGLFYGAQTLRQLLPPTIEHPAAFNRRLFVPVGKVVDSPRYEWRGMMLDVSRHFLPPADVKRFIDHIALFKINRLHLHLSDDQGWRIEIKSRPSLTAIGGSTQVGGGKGGFYTQDEYRDIVAYAASRFMTVIPEIDMPGHTNAALTSIPELNCDKVAPPAYTGTRVGFSALCVDSAVIYPVLEDIVREISSLTPGPYFHIGGDEVMKLTHTQYLAFIERMQEIVSANGKRMIGWGEIAPAKLSPNTIVQNWKKDSSFLHSARGGRVILSPATKIYLDQQYDTTTILGLHWAAYSSLQNAYDWEPSTFLPGVAASSILGVEGPLWSETVVKVQDFEFLAFPRVIAVAEIGWSQMHRRSWISFADRLNRQAKRLDALGINAGK